MVNPLDPSDSELAVRIQARDAQAFELLFERYGGALQRYLAGMVRDDADPEAAAQDLAQEVFLRVWTRAEQWSGQGSFKSWLYRIGTNLALNRLRSRKRHPVQPLANEDARRTVDGDDVMAWEEEISAPGWLVDGSALGPAEAMEQYEFNAAVHHAIDALPEEKREVFRLVHEMELSIRDTAGRLGIPEGTVKSRLHYAQKQAGRTFESMMEDGNDD